MPAVTWHDIWAFSAESPYGHAPAPTTGSLPDMSRGSGRWSVVTLPSAPDMRKALALGVPGLDSEGFHLTPTIDFIVVLDGPVTLVLDDGERQLQVGDLVVQRGTNHAWWNYNDYPIRLLTLMLGTGA